MGAQERIQKLTEAADAQDRRRQRQIAQQAARIDSMKELVHQLAGTVQSLQRELYGVNDDRCQSTGKIIEDAVKAGGGE